ncbi:MAG: HD domain-containing protein [Ilumatobacter sp.]
MNADSSPTDAVSDVVSFTAMEDGTAADYALLDRFEQEHASGLANRLLETLARLTESMGGYQITRLEHSLQSATRARRDGADLDWVVAALLHDIGDELAPFNHSELAASILQPYVREEVHWVVLHHGVFQSYYFAHHLGGDRHARDRFADHRWADLCAQFCARWDQNSFDPGFPIDPLDSFADDLRTVFAREPWSPAVIAAGPMQLVA